MNTLIPRCRVASRAAALVTVMVFTMLAAAAHADQPPGFTAGPAIEGRPTIGAQLRIAASWNGVPSPGWTYEWQRCDASGLYCSVVQGACGASYTLTDRDMGGRFRGRVSLFNRAGTATATTPLTDLVVAAPPAPMPGPTVTAPAAASVPCQANLPPPELPPAEPAAPAAEPAAPAAEPPPAQPLPDVRASGASGTASARPAYMRPFPIVRIRGYVVRGGARITMLSVRGKASARIRATCVGAGCPRGDPPPASPPARLRAFERFLLAGTLLQIRVTDGPMIGKYTSFRILAGHAPQRTDRCLLPGRWWPVRCPAA
jgi:hypothetical protein